MPGTTRVERLARAMLIPASDPRGRLRELRAAFPRREWKTSFDDRFGTVLLWRGKNAPDGSKWHLFKGETA